MVRGRPFYNSFIIPDQEQRPIVPSGSGTGGKMQVLIVQSSHELGLLWKRHIEWQRYEVALVHGQMEATEFLREREVQVMILDLVLSEGSALAVADFASYRWPGARVIFVTNTTFFSDGSIFNHASNACAFLQSETPPEDLAAMVAYHGAASR